MDMKRYPLGMLPNQCGFRFIGISVNKERWECEVRHKEHIGCSVYRISDDAPVFSQLASWEWA